MSMVNPPQNYDDPHRYNPSVHYRLYDSPRSGPMVLCVQDFNYEDYDSRRFLSSEAWDDEDEALAVLRELLSSAETLNQLPQAASATNKLMTRAVVAENLRAGDIADVVFDPVVGSLKVVKYRQPFD